MMYLPIIQKKYGDLRWIPNSHGKIIQKWVISYDFPVHCSPQFQEENTF